MIHRIHGLVWGPVLLGILLLAGCVLTIDSEGFQFMGLGSEEDHRGKGEGEERRRHHGTGES